MKTSILPTRAQMLNIEIQKAISEKFGTRLERIKAETIYNYYFLGLEIKNIKKINLVHDFYSEQVVKFVKNLENNCYTVTLKNGKVLDVNESEMFSIYKPNRKVSQKVKKVVKPTDGMRFAVATVRKSRKGNDRFLHKNGRFNCSYANRYIYNTMRGAEALIARIYAEQGMKPNTLKVVSA